MTAASRTLPLCQSRLLSDLPGIVHGVTRRVEGLGKAHGNIGYTAPRDRDDAWEMRGLWCQALGLGREQLSNVHQVHGAAVHVARSDAPPPVSAPLADAQITNEPGVALMTLHADCMPIILCDPAIPAVGAIHAGWRGTTLDVAGAAVRKMVDVFGADPTRMTAFLGPSIGACCYEVGDDVRSAWSAAAPDAIDDAIAAFGDRWRFDLDAANRWLLRRAGLADSRIESSGVCTRCEGDDWFSHRGQGPDTGRYGAIVAII